MIVGKSFRDSGKNGPLPAVKPEIFFFEFKNTLSDVGTGIMCSEKFGCGDAVLSCFDVFFSEHRYIRLKRKHGADTRTDITDLFIYSFNRIIPDAGSFHMLMIVMRGRKRFANSFQRRESYSEYSVIKIEYVLLSKALDKPLNKSVFDPLDHVSLEVQAHHGEVNDSRETDTFKIVMPEVTLSDLFESVLIKTHIVLVIILGGILDR